MRQITEFINKVHLGNNIDILKEIPDESVDCMVTDPPYFLINKNGSGFMGKEWDSISGQKTIDIICRSKGHAKNVVEFFMLMRAKSSMEEDNVAPESVNIVPEKGIIIESKSSVLFVEENLKETSHKSKVSINSVPVIVLTKVEVLDMLKELSPININVIENLPESVLFVVPILYIQNLLKNIVPENVLKFPIVEICVVKNVSFTSTVEVRIKNAIAVTIGKKLEEESMNVTTGSVDCVENVVIKKKYNVITLNPIEKLKIIQWITLLLFVSSAIIKQKEDLNYSVIRQFHKNWLEESYRVLKAGAFVFIMSSPRQDVLNEMFTAIRQAGFETGFTSIYWTYACLSNDTEILMRDGWERWCNTNIFKSKEILIYDCETDNYRWEIPTQWHSYKIKDTCYRIKSDFTEQLVTRNHSVLIEQDGKLLFQFAERLRQTVSVPYLESMSILSKNISNLSGMVKEKNKYGEILFNQLQTESKYPPISIGKWEAYSSDVGGTKTETKSRNDGKQKPCLERWSYILQDTWELYWSEICSLPSRIFIDGSQRWLCDGTPTNCGTAFRTLSSKNRSRAPHKSQSDRQSVREFSTLREQPISQIIRERKSYETTMATVTKEWYEGIVFCPTISTGCFVARRNGKIFLTGNSGFPKATNIGKMIDARMGVKREIIGDKSDYEPGYKTPRRTPIHGGDISSEFSLPITVPASPEAKSLDGSYTGFSPKPAVEIIIVAMKPLSEKTYMEQALKNSHGITWLDNCRIPYQSKSDYEEVVNNFKGGIERASPEEKETWNFHGDGWKLGEKIEIPDITKGRFPANLLVSDDVLNDGKKHDAGDLTGQCGTAGNVYGTYNRDRKLYLKGNPVNSYSQYFSLDAWFDETFKKLPPEVQSVFPFLIVPKASKSERNKGCVSINKGNIHVSVKPLKLFSYLITLGSQRDNIILDPFMGSGTLGMACLLLNRRFICIDIEPDYVEIAKKRINYIQSNRHMSPMTGGVSL